MESSGERWELVRCSAHLLGGPPHLRHREDLAVGSSAEPAALARSHQEEIPAGEGEGRGSQTASTSAIVHSLQSRFLPWLSTTAGQPWGITPAPWAWHRQAYNLPTPFLARPGSGSPVRQCWPA